MFNFLIFYYFYLVYLCSSLYFLSSDNFRFFVVSWYIQLSCLFEIFKNLGIYCCKLLLVLVLLIIFGMYFNFHLSDDIFWFVLISLVYWFFKSMLYSPHIFLYFVVFLLPLASGFIPLQWKEVLDMILIFFSLLSLCFLS